ncbi:ATP/GTP-binding protein [Paenibacillus sp. YN15]|uniref:AAA family ATPase n=1 Tax=Paenibacillus sp. YN15 TaxID=1742774 RepID=UPI000DCE279E|nr:ATP-binding protein [Paenibacillus sp. YN15]RAU97142.1 ATP-binding protein [Paenibacillus sp. YN15]
MLRSIEMENFRSFKNRTKIDMTATGYKSLSGTNVHKDIVKGCFLFGANASGKTNAIRALEILLDLLFAEKISTLTSDRCLFSRKKEIFIKYEFDVEGETIQYILEFHIEKKHFIEKLLVDGETAIDRIGSNATSTITENKVFEDITPEGLLLREIFFNTKFRMQPLLKKWFDFLLNSVFVDGYKERVFSPGKFSLNITDYLQEIGVKTINQFFEQFGFNQRIEYGQESKGKIVTIKSVNEAEIFFKREGVGEPIPFPWESLGNQKLLRLLPPFFHVVQNGGMLIIDEFSSGLHNFLEELLVRYFMNNSSNAQLFVVTHSTNLLSNSLLRPDQIYAVDFNGMEGSSLKRFSSEQPRVAQNLEKMYTAGVFGGVPQYRDDDYTHTQG